MARPESLVIRNAQLGTLGLGMFDRFLERLEAQIAQCFPDHADFIRSRCGRQFMTRCVEKARAYGLKDQHSITLFTDMAVALGEGFDDQPGHAWIRRLLDDTGLGAAGKMYLIYKELPHRCPEQPVPAPPFLDTDDNEDFLIMEPPPLVNISRQPLWWGESES